MQNMSPNQLLLKFGWQYKGLALLTILLGFSGALFNGVSTTLIVPVLLGFLGQQEINLQGAPPILQKMLSLFDGVPPNYRLLVMVGTVLSAIVLKNITSYISSISSSYLSRTLVNAIRKEGIKLLLEVDLDFYAKTKIGDLINSISQEINRTANAIRVVIRILTTLITITVFVVILILISWQLTLGSTILLLIVTFANQYFVKRAKYFGQLLSEKSRAYSVAIYEVLTGIRLIKTVSNEGNEYQRLETLLHDYEKAELRAAANFALISPINEVVGILVILAIVFLGRTLFLQELESLSAVLLTYLVVLFRLLPFVSQLNGERSDFANAAPGAEVVAEFLRRDNKPFMKNGQIPYQGFEKGIGLEGLSFAYPGHEDLVLNQIDLWVPRGTTLALVGSSGAGKSTLADLLPRFYDPIEGRITLDGRDIKDFDLRSLRRSMGIVSQDTFLFNDSVANNIAYGSKDATKDDILAAAKRANAYEFIAHLPQGFDTTIGDRGVLLSGGQRQRIAIARALLRNPEILILDEATSALDTVSERLVQQAIDEICRDRTTVVIAHRLSTVQKAHQIAVLEKGRVVEIGTHDQLLEKGGYYNRLYSMQFNADTQDMIEAAFNKAMIRTSYEVRTRLNPLIGYLQLVVDGMADSLEERQELTEEAYNSAIRLLKVVEYLEETGKIK